MIGPVGCLLTLEGLLFIRCPTDSADTVSVGFASISRNTVLPVQMCDAASHGTEAGLVQLGWQSWAKAQNLTACILLCRGSGSKLRSS